MDMAFVDFLARAGHILFGIAWIGLLYYFNFVQTPYMAVGEAKAKVDVFTKLVPKAMWYFRWAAMFTFLTGLVLLGFKGAGASVDITVGAVLGTLMFLNVWLIIWPNQRIMIASNQAVADGGSALPEAAAAGPKAALASRTNTLFSVSMLYFMVGSAHYMTGTVAGADSLLGLIVALAIIAGLEANAIFGKPGPIATVKGVIHCALGLVVVLGAVVRFL